MGNIAVKTEGLTKIYTRGSEKIHAVDGVSLEISEGSFVALMGPSGSGKTTLLDLVGCLDNSTSGKIEVFGQDVSRASESYLTKLRRGKIGFIFQEFLLIPSLTVIENIELSLYFSRLSRSKDYLKELLTKVGLGHRINHLPKQLSGGERQRVAVARSLAVSPKLLIADEPTGNLDTKNSQEIFDLFRKLNKEEGLTIVLATHNPALGSQADRIVNLRDGRVV